MFVYSQISLESDFLLCSLDLEESTMQYIKNDYSIRNFGISRESQTVLDTESRINVIAYPRIPGKPDPAEISTDSRQAGIIINEFSTVELNKLVIMM